MVRSILLAAVFSTLAFLSTSHALSVVAERRAPRFAAQQFPSNGFASGELAVDTFQTVIAANATSQNFELTDVLDRPSTQTITGLARSAFIKEPLSSDAIAMAGMAAVAEGDEKRGRSILEAGRLLTKRERIINVWLMTDAMQTGEIDRGLASLDLILRQNRQGDGPIYDVLINALAQDQSVEAFEGLLTKQPPWAERFWVAAVKRDDAIINAAELRRRLVARGIEDTAGTDTPLVSRLLKIGSFSEAIALRNQLVRRDKFQRAGLRALSIPPKALPPIDWELFSEGNFGAQYLEDNQDLVISAIDGSGGVIARKLVDLPAGNYRLNLATNDAPDLDTELVVSLHCAKGTRSGAEIFTTIVTGTKTDTTFQTSTPSCQYFWLELAIEIPENGQAQDIVIEELSIVRL